MLCRYSEVDVGGLEAAAHLQYTAVHCMQCAILQYTIVHRAVQSCALHGVIKSCVQEQSLEVAALVLSQPLPQFLCLCLQLGRRPGACKLCNIL